MKCFCISYHMSYSTYISFNNVTVYYYYNYYYIHIHIREPPSRHSCFERMRLHFVRCPREKRKHELVGCWCRTCVLTHCFVRRWLLVRQSAARPPPVHRHQDQLCADLRKHTLDLSDAETTDAGVVARLWCTRVTIRVLSEGVERAKNPTRHHSCRHEHAQKYEKTHKPNVA